MSPHQPPSRSVPSKLMVLPLALLAGVGILVGSAAGDDPAPAAHQHAAPPHAAPSAPHGHRSD